MCAEDTCSSEVTALWLDRNRYIIIRPHRSSTYVDAAYCYQPSSMVGRSITLVSPAKTTAPIEMPPGLRTLVGPRNHVLDGVQIPPWEGAILGGGEMGVPL